MTSPIPVTVLTGYLGSGKTTLLQRLLGFEGGARTAVLINEFGEIGIDHLMVKSISGTTVVLQNGCICCSVRSDLQGGLRDLIDGRSKGEIPEFDRILVETTGIADPVPIVQTLVADPMLRNQVFLANLVSTVDGLNGIAQLNNAVEAMRQVATADRLVMTKTDLCEGDQTDLLRARLSVLNPTAPVIDSQSSHDLWVDLLGHDTVDPYDKAASVRAWLARLETFPGTARHVDHGSPQSDHNHSVHSFVVRLEQKIDWSAFAVWLSALVHRHGGNLLRIKGLLNVPEARGPVVLNAVQNFIHPPYHLDDWPDSDHSSRLVFIVQDMDEKTLRRSLEGFLEQAAIPEPTSLAETSPALGSSA